MILFKYDLDNQIKDMHQSQSDYEDIYSKYNDTTREIKKILNEVKKKVFYYYTVKWTKFIF